VSLTNLILQGRSHDVINHITIQLAIYYFLLVSHWIQASIFDHFQDICIQIYLDHDLDLSGSRDVIAHGPFDSPGAISYRCCIVT